MTFPVATCGLTVPPGGIEVPTGDVMDEIYHFTMAAIDPTEIPSKDAQGATSHPPRATLVLVRESNDDELDEDASDMGSSDGPEDESEGDDDESSNDNAHSNEKRANGANQNSKKSASKKASPKAKNSGVSDDSLMEMDSPASTKSNDIQAEDDDSEDQGVEEFVICTLDPKRTYQQPIDISIPCGEHAYFKVKGNIAVHLTGNIIKTQPYYDSGEEDDSDDELDQDGLTVMDYDESADDELDDLETPRLSEITSDDEEIPKLIEGPKANSKAEKSKALVPKEDLNPKHSNKRSADSIASKDSKPGQPDSPANGTQQLSKRQLKKLKANSGKALPAGEDHKATPPTPAKPNGQIKESPASNRSDKKVQFAKSLEQGPTPPKTTGKENEKAEEMTSSNGDSVKIIQGIKIIDKKKGEGPVSKKGDKVSMRYIGKLQNGGRVFDSNKKGKPFTFSLGAGEVIKGWDLGVSGMAVGGERRIVVPPNMGYGSKTVGQIPPGSTLVFDVKMISIN